MNILLILQFIIVDVFLFYVCVCHYTLKHQNKGASAQVTNNPYKNRPKYYPAFNFFH